MMANLPSRWRHAGQIGAQDGQLGTILGAILAHLGHLGANFNENVKNQKTFKNLLFLKVVGWSGGPSGAIWKPCCMILGILAASWASWGASGEKWCPRGGQNAAKMAQDALKEANLSEHGSQDGAVMAYLAPKTANLAPS